MRTRSFYAQGFSSSTLCASSFTRSLTLPDAVQQWSLTMLREKLVKIGAKIVRHGSYITFQIAEPCLVSGFESRSSRWKAPHGTIRIKGVANDD